MIGVVGPDDSTTLALRVAAELGIGDRVIARAYDSADEAAALAAELDKICAVILFTGRVPYALARRDHGVRATLDFVPHGGADLYRTLVLVLRANGGLLPRVSVDTIERATVDETYHDLDLAPPRHVLSLDPDGDDDGVRVTADITAFHVNLATSRQVDLCLTCLRSVRDELAARGIPVVRVEHTHATLRDALQRATLADRLARSEATQAAVALIEPLAPQARPPSRYERERLELHVRERALDLAERLQGTLVDGESGTFLIHSTRGAVDSVIGRLGGVLDPPGSDTPLPFAVGFGVGGTVASAEEQARQALALARKSGEIHLVHEDGSVLKLGHDRVPTGYRLRQTDPRVVERAHELGIGPVTLARLAEALRRLDSGAVTARDLARSYGVTPRSALRLLALLEAAGVATVLGTQVAPRAGRPQTVYRVDPDALLPR